MNEIDSYYFYLTQQPVTSYKEAKELIELQAEFELVRLEDIKTIDIRLAGTRSASPGSHIIVLERIFGANPPLVSSGLQNGAVYGSIRFEGHTKSSLIGVGVTKRGKIVAICVFKDIDIINSTVSLNSEAVREGVETLERIELLSNAVLPWKSVT